MYLQHNGRDARSLFSKLAPAIDEPGIAVATATPARSPWRVIMIGSQAGRLIESNIVINLNPPSAIADTSWIKPGKTAWDWWSGSVAEGVDFKPGMNTATMRHYIDFSAESGLEYMLIDAGWAQRGNGTVGLGQRSHENQPEYRYARDPGAREAEEVRRMAVGPLDRHQPANGRGVRALREVGHCRREDRLHGPRRPVDGRLLPPRPEEGRRPSPHDRPAWRLQA